MSNNYVGACGTFHILINLDLFEFFHLLYLIITSSNLPQIIYLAFIDYCRGGKSGIKIARETFLWYLIKCIFYIKIICILHNQPRKYSRKEFFRNQINNQFTASLLHITQFLFIFELNEDINDIQITFFSTKASMMLIRVKEKFISFGKWNLW